MSLGDLVIGFSADTARFQADMGKAAQMLEKFGSIAKLNSKSAQDAIKGLSDEGVANILRLQRSFNALNIKSQLQIDFEKNKLIAHFEAIKNSGVASMNEIARAKVALDNQLNKLDGNVAKTTEGFNLMGLASVGAILKIQLLYSTVNTLMSAIGKAPSIAVSAIEDFNSSAINNAAMITSMQKGVKDIGKAYQENKIYSEAVQNVLVKMDAETAASAKNLRDMNNQFVQQGVLIDINSAKQVEGFKSVANALAAITAGDPNQAMQYSQEIRALKSFEDKGSNRLVQMLRAQGVTKEMYEQWKASGTVLEEMGKRLQGFAAAQGDINNLWATTKSTMETIRDEVLRGGLSTGFAEIVRLMKELSSEAEKNKEKIQAFLKNSLSGIISFGKGMFDVGVFFAKLAEPAMWSAIVIGLTSATGAIRTMAAEITIATGGLNLLIGGMTTLAIFGVKKWAESANAKLDVNEIKSMIPNPAAIKAGVPLSHFNSLSENLDIHSLSQIKERFPMASNDRIAYLIRERAIDLKRNEFNQSSNAVFNETQLKELEKLNTSNVKIPKGVKTATGDDKAKTYSEWNSFVQAFNGADSETELDNYDRKLEKINDRISNMINLYKSVPEADRKAFDNASKEETLKSIERIKNALIDRAKEEELLKANPIIDIFNKANDKGEINPLQKKLASVDTELENVKNKLLNASQAVKDFLEGKGINKDTLDKVFGGVKERITTEEDIKRAKVLTSATIGVDKIKGSTPDMWGKVDPKIALAQQYNDELLLLKDKMAEEEKLYGKQTAVYNKYLEERNALTVKNAAQQKVLETEKWMGVGNIVAGQLGQIASMMDKNNKKQFEQWKALSIAQATISTALAVAGILGNKAIFGPEIAIPLATMAGAIGAFQIAKIAATPYQAREFGGPVTAGQSYIVGEKRPELFTPGASGVITPYVPSMKDGLTVSPVFQISTGVAETAQAEIMRYAPSLVQLTVDAVKDAINSGGDMSMAVGRM